MKRKISTRLAAFMLALGMAMPTALPVSALEYAADAPAAETPETAMAAEVTEQPTETPQVTVEEATLQTYNAEGEKTANDSLDQTAEKQIASFAELDEAVKYLNYSYKPDLAEVQATLPRTLVVNYADGTTGEIEVVSWNCATDYEETAAEYYFVPTLPASINAGFDALMSIPFCHIGIQNSKARVQFWQNTVSGNTEWANGVVTLSGMQYGDTCRNWMQYLVFDSRYNAMTGQAFPYPNNNDGYFYNINDGIYSVNIYGSKGCFAYANYVSQLMYGRDVSSQVWPYESAGNFTGTGMKTFLRTYAQAGDHIRVNNVHSMSFVACEDGGFFFLNYQYDGNPYIKLQFATYDYFASVCNSTGNNVWIYDCNYNNVDPDIPINDLTVTNLAYPTNKQSGKSFTVYGTLSAPENITQLTLEVIDYSGARRFGADATPNTTSFNLHDFDAQMTFAGLADGYYIYHLYTRTAHQAINFTYGFTVNGNATTRYSYTNSAPQVGTASISDVTPTGYTVNVTIGGDTDGDAISRVQFPTWTTANGQDDLLSGWETSGLASGSITGNTATFRVNTADHGNETGQYYTDVYIYDANNNWSFLGSQIVEVPTAEEYYAVTGVTLNKTTLSLTAGSSSTLTATVSPSNAVNKNITWSSSNTSVATISGGKVTAVKAGTATITAKSNNGKTATCKVTVTAKATATATPKPSTATATPKPSTATATPKPSTATPTATPKPSTSGGTTGGTTGGTASTTGVEGFVDRLYSVCLGRPADAAGKADWVGQLTSYQISGTKAAFGFIFSQEFTNMNYSNADYVEHLYEAFMGRASDEGGKADWVGKLDAGATREEVFNGFANSVEFDNICKSYGIVSKDIETFVTRLYSVCLDRQPDEAGLADWANQLRSQTISGKAAASGFVFSEEFTSKNYSNADYVEHLYAAFMGRASDEAGKADWVGKLDAGTTREEVFNGFANSAEFDNICASYGIVRG